MPSRLEITSGAVSKCFLAFALSCISSWHPLDLRIKDRTVAEPDSPPSVLANIACRRKCRITPHWQAAVCPGSTIDRDERPAYGGGSDDAFVTKLNAAGNALVYSTYLGGRFVC